MRKREFAVVPLEFNFTEQIPLTLPHPLLHTHIPSSHLLWPSAISGVTSKVLVQRCE